MRLAVLAGLVLLAGGVVWWMTRGRSVAPDDGINAPRNAADQQTQLVGARRCAECHAEQARAHAASGHSRTFHRSKDSPIAMSLCGQSIPASGEYEQFDYRCDDEGLMVGVEKKFGGRLFPLDFALGSGDHAMTFLTLIQGLDAEGGLLGIEHRQTWYRSSGKLGITPGQKDWIPEREVEHFGKSFQGETLRRCIDCHTTTFEIVGDKLENLVAGVQCEECHGAGAEHVAAAETGDARAAAAAILRPRTPHEEVQLCGRCHRLPSDIAADRLARYPPSVTRFQPVGLMQSRCYLESEGRLGCLNCHDAHGPLSSRTMEDQVASCRGCHQEGGDSLCSAGREADCIRCHMRKLELIPGIYFHDHWIRRNPEPATPASGDEATVSGEVDER